MADLRWITRSLRRLRCPHHGPYCHGRTCCCRGRHWRPIKVWRELRAVGRG